MPKYLKTIVTALVAVLCATTGCDSSPDSEQRARTRELLAESNRQIGMPGVTNFTEKRLLRQLYELRDQQDLATFTYVVDYQGRLWHVCDSIGYGMPFSAQFSNPERTVSSTSGATLPQPEPNGLWPPTSTSATWVICASPDGAFQPVYVEPAITVSPFRLAEHGSWTDRATLSPD